MSRKCRAFVPFSVVDGMDNLPDGCGCRAFTWVFCINLNLTRVPDTMKSSLTKLILINNSVTIVERGSFSRYPGLKVIHLEGNGLRYLHEGAFTGLFNLVFLFLSRNKIEKLNGGTFKDLKKLEWLLLDDNKLEEFDFSILADTPSLHLLDLSTNSLTLKKVYFRAHPYLRWLSLSKNQIEKIKRDHFQYLVTLEVLFLNNNHIWDIENGAFRFMERLVELDLSHNRLRFLRQHIFDSLVNLTKLNLSFNPLTSLPLTVFAGLKNLKSLDLKGFGISNINVQHFKDLSNLEFIYFKKFHYCSFTPYVRICTPKTDGLSSMEHLLVWPVLRLCVWFVALMTCLGNILVIGWRALSRKEDHVLSLFIKNLAVADFLMGIYLLAIGSQDISYRDFYNRHAHLWMSSWQCTACGILAMLSCEVSVLILSLITLERYRCIRTNYRVVTVSTARYSLAAVWTFGVILALFPTVLWTSDRSFYSSNGFCFPLHIDDPYTLGWQYSAFIFLGINFSAMMMIIILYLRMFHIIRRDRQKSRPVMLKKHEDAVLALRFFFIVLTDCLCWIPIVVIKIIAFSEIVISENLYACVVIFILPINSALNPVIYTIAAPTELRRRLRKALSRLLICQKCLERLMLLESKAATSSILTQSIGSTEVRSLSNGSLLATVGRSSTSSESSRRMTYCGAEIIERAETVV
ncbi:relaxin receptor 2-like isoform X2 [Centruroides vittatus]|uniref:relaxin receptor 2-like isoform X2 n=1 Tax=Centruroides vittatus TaxID=120091 RepID=UPI00350E9D36